jgi:hypothetical protein
MGLFVLLNTHPLTWAAREAVTGRFAAVGAVIGVGSHGVRGWVIGG